MTEKDSRKKRSAVSPEHTLQERSNKNQSNNSNNHHNSSNNNNINNNNSNNNNSYNNNSNSRNDIPTESSTDIHKKCRVSIPEPQADSSLNQQDNSQTEQSSSKHDSVQKHYTCTQPISNKVSSSPVTEEQTTALNNNVNNHSLRTSNPQNPQPINQEPTTTDKLETREKTNAHVNWPWIPLTTSTGKTYYYNALTSKTSWTMDQSDDNYYPKDPPSTFIAAAAQASWQSYWLKWQEARSAGSISKTVPGLTRPPPTTVEEPNDDSVESNTQQLNNDVTKKNMSVYVEHYQSPTAQQLGRAARQQVKPPDNESLGYTQGFEEYNIWYGKHLTDRFDHSGQFGRREEREKATTRCNPFTDSGWTRCDLEPPLDCPVICVYFARGCCYLGSSCRYYHRLPTSEDNEKLDMLHDIFGRERFASHRDDMDGVGTFSEDCRTLFVGDLKVNRVYPNAEEKTEELIRQQFGLWGPIETIKVIRNKNIAFVRYKYRVHAEFAKVAMAEQRLLLDRSDDQICVKWAHAGRGNEDNPQEQQAQEWDMANRAMMKRLSALGYTQEDIECLIRWELQQAEEQKQQQQQQRDISEPKHVTSHYPNTEERFQQQLITLVPLAEQPFDHNDDSDDLTNELIDPTSNASIEFFKMQSALSRVEAHLNNDTFAVDI